VPNTKMKAWKSKLSEEDRWKLVAFERNFGLSGKEWDVAKKEWVPVGSASAAAPAGAAPAADGGAAPAADGGAAPAADGGAAPAADGGAAPAAPAPTTPAAPASGGK